MWPPSTKKGARPRRMRPARRRPAPRPPGEHACGRGASHGHCAGARARCAEHQPAAARSARGGPRQIRARCRVAPYAGAGAGGGGRGDGPRHGPAEANGCRGRAWHGSKRPAERYEACRASRAVCKAGQSGMQGWRHGVAARINPATPSGGAHRTRSKTTRGWAWAAHRSKELPPRHGSRRRGLVPRVRCYSRKPTPPSCLACRRALKLQITRRPASSGPHDSL